MIDARRTLRPIRIALLLGAVLGACYIGWRFEWVGLPAENCCPLLRFSPGNQLLFDTRPGEFAVGDAVLYETPDDSLALAEIVRIEGTGGEERYWLEVDVPRCPGPSSRSNCVARRQTRLPEPHAGCVDSPGAHRRRAGSLR